MPSGPVCAAPWVPVGIVAVQDQRVLPILETYTQFKVLPVQRDDCADLSPRESAGAGRAGLCSGVEIIDGIASHSVQRCKAHRGVLL